MSSPQHLQGVPRAGRSALEQALEGVRREQRESVTRIHVVVTKVAAVDGAFYALELEKMPSRVEELRLGTIELAVLDLFHGEAKGSIVEVDEARCTIFVQFTLGVPRLGPCTVYPFNFLEPLVRFYDRASRDAALGELAERALAAALGAFPARISATGTPFDRLWSQRWGVVWGPPGTGKTTTLARELAARFHEGRTLFVSTTNQATDTAALRFGACLAAAGHHVGLGRRVGPGARARAFVEAGLEAMLPDVAPTAREALAMLETEIDREDDLERLTAHHGHAHQLRQQLVVGPSHFLDASARVVFTTVHAGLRCLDGRGPWSELLRRIEEGDPPFDTVVIDEAGQVPLATAAMLSLLARRRVLLAGDPRQLAPISRAARVFAPSVKRFIAQSAIDGLALPAPGAEIEDPTLLFLDTQHRSEAPIGALISRYQYEGRLKTSPALASRPRAIPELPPAVLLVLDEEPEARRDPPRTSAERPQGRSWRRPLSVLALGRLFDAYPALARARGLLITPFVAQRELFAQFIEARGISDGFAASTIHAQQGNEADVVVFDPVHAGSIGWDEVEWRRLVNVALSRARSSVVVLASRDELRQPFLSPLVELMPTYRMERRRLAPIARDERSANGALLAAEPVATYRATRRDVPSSHRIGDQIAGRHRLHPVLGLEQERLRRMRLDEGPRLVRGVAGSGKTLVAVRWAIRSLASAPPSATLLFVYGNRALAPLLKRSLADAAAEDGLRWPDPRLHLRHAGDVLSEHAGEIDVEPWQYERLAAALAQRELEPTYDELFIDEAQDFGEAALRQLFRLVITHDGAGGPRKALRIFYDDAQQIYGRARPSWASLGLDLRGRSVVMRESFRSTRGIGELAMNVLASIEGKVGDGLAELVDDQLVTVETHDGRSVVRSRHHLFDGPAPSVRVCADRAEEWAWVIDSVKRALVEQAVRPSDIKVLAMHDHVRDDLFDQLARALDGTSSVRQVGRGQAPSDASCVEILTPHAMKGYEAELVFVVAADTYCAKGAPLPRVLYTAMTRARSLLFVSGARGVSGLAGDDILDALKVAQDGLASTSPAES